MVETASTNKLEALAVQTKRAQDCIRITDQILQQYGINAGLTEPGRVIFKSAAAINEEDKRQVIATSPIAKAIIERDLPVQPISNKRDFDAIVLNGSTQGPHFAVSFTIGEFYLRKDPEALINREAMSYASVLLFSNLLRLAIDHQASLVELDRKPETLRVLRADMLATIKSFAEGDNEASMTELADETAKTTRYLDELSVTGKGAEVELRVNGLTLIRFNEGDNAQVLAMINTAYTGDFIHQMSRRVSWFVPPTSWKNLESAKYHMDSKKTSRQILENIRNSDPDYEMPEDPQTVLELFLSGEFSRRKLPTLVRKLEGNPKIIEQLSSEKEPENLEEKLKALQKGQTIQDQEVEGEKAEGVEEVSYITLNGQRVDLSRFETTEDETDQGEEELNASAQIPDDDDQYESSSRTRSSKRKNNTE
ncbi:MAG TPA: hypothetical protein VLE91_04520 [Candidatus Saccharimonadales bacterium]|nr:hypothetical protein [Candidatus Saccharimonadales bacterium]